MDGSPFCASAGRDIGEPTMNDDTAPAAESAVKAEDPSGSIMEKQIRRAGLLLLIGLAAQGLSLLGLHTPVGFMAFAAFAGTFIAFGMAYFLWAVVRGSTTIRDS